VLEIVDDALAIEKVHGGAEEIPVQRLGEAQTLLGTFAIAITSLKEMTCTAVTMMMM
jgi:hypothetical protein